eukprot:gene5236-5289_t
MLTGPAAEGTVSLRSWTSISAWRWPESGNVAGGVMRTSMAKRYGPFAGLRKAAAVLCCGLFIVLLAIGPALAAKPRLLVLGDSLAAGYGLAPPDAFQAKLAKAFPEVTLIDAAVSGDTTAGGLARLDWALADGAEAAIVELGGNDGLRAIDPRNTRQNLTAILDALQKRGIPVLLSGMYAPPNLGDAYQAEFRAVFDDLGKRPGVVYDPFFLEGVAGDPALNQADRIHPNPTGVDKVIARIKPKLRQRLSGLCVALPGARWVPPENLHMTLRFVGEVQPNQAEDIDLALAALRGKRVALEIRGVGTVNKAGREVALWAGVARNPALEHLQAKIETALQRAGLAPEKRRFTPHVTLARLDGVVESKLAAYLQTHNLFRFGPVEIDHITLFSSQLGKEASVYTAEVDYPLG